MSTIWPHQDETCNSLTQGCPETGSNGGAQCALRCFSEAIRSDQHTVCWKKLSSSSISHSFPHLCLMILGQHANTAVHFVKFNLRWWYALSSSQLTFWGCWNANMTSRFPKQNWWDAFKASTKKIDNFGIHQLNPPNLGGLGIQICPHSLPWSLSRKSGFWVAHFFFKIQLFSLHWFNN